MPPSRSRTATTSTRRSCRPSRRSGWRRTSTRAPCGSWTSCPRDRPGRSCAARSARPRRSPHERGDEGRGRGDTDPRGRRDRGEPRRRRSAARPAARRRHQQPTTTLHPRHVRGPVHRRPGPAPAARRGTRTRSDRRAGQDRGRPLRGRARREGPPLLRGGLGQEPGTEAHPAELSRDGRGRARAGRGRRARLGRRPADGLHRRQPRRGLRAEQQPVPQPEGAQAHHRHRRRQPRRGRSTLRPRLRQCSRACPRWSSPMPSRSAPTSP